MRAICTTHSVGFGHRVRLQRSHWLELRVAGDFFVRAHIKADIYDLLKERGVLCVELAPHVRVSTEHVVVPLDAAVASICICGHTASEHAGNGKGKNAFCIEEDCDCDAYCPRGT